jgi:DNA-binding SARP family transcriptional activator
VAERARAAVELLAPGFLPEDDGPWVVSRRREIEEVELEALEWLARSGLGRRGSELITAERAGRELIARSPYRETGYRFVMEALAAGGNVAEALRVYDRLRVLLRDELGVAPAAELQALHGRLLTGERVTAPATVARVPLPRALSPTNRSAFVGREGELAALRAAWERIHGGGRHLVLLAGEPASARRG